MKSILFPIGLLGEPEVWNLSTELKLVLAGSACHFNFTACGAIHLSGIVSASLGVAHPVLVHLATELDRRRVAVFDEQTDEFFILKNFYWHKTTAEVGDGSPWSKNVFAALARVRSEKIRAAVLAALAAAPADKIKSILVPANLLSSLPSPTTGGFWCCSELLMILCCYTHPLQNCAGFFVAQLSVIGEFCSVPQKTVLENFLALDAAGGLIFDEKTREVFMPIRLKNAQLRDQKEVEKSGQEIRSRRAKNAFSKQYFRTFGKQPNKSTACRPLDVNQDVNFNVNSTTTVAAGVDGGSGGGFDEEEKDLLVMFEQQAKSLGKPNPPGWARAAVKRIRLTGLDSNEKRQLEEWRAKQKLWQQQKIDQQKKDDETLEGGAVGKELVGKTLRSKNGTLFKVERLGIKTPGALPLALSRVFELVKNGDYELVA